VAKVSSRERKKHREEGRGRKEQCLKGQKERGGRIKGKWGKFFVPTSNGGGVDRKGKNHCPR